MSGPDGGARPDLNVAPQLVDWWRAARGELNGGDAAAVHVVDAHTHIGEHDPDTMRCSAAELIAHLEQSEADGVVFPLREPDGYPHYNDLAIAAAAESGGRLTALGRVDPARSPAQEARRVLDAGARGLKLHPRGEEFQLDDARLEETWAIAHERQVPVIVHAGRGIPSLGAHAVQVATRYPGVRLILAHAGISDLSWIGRQAQELPNLYFDTSWWSPADLLTLFATVPAGQILFASDAPYGRTSTTALGMVRLARQAGLDDARIRLVMGEQMQRLLDGEEPLDGGQPSGVTKIAVDVLLDRVSGYISAAFGQLTAGAQNPEMLSLARLSCAVPADSEQAAHCRVIVELLDEYDRVVAAAAEHERAGMMPPGVYLLGLAGWIARTPDVPVPETLGLS
ncbi:amidohydrolase family protein [Conexibacter sp. JD483]|uniref:amidohydrolase family protein n=1 Tax=unclassified Conexibacter TaxID=2627773 RepID=UPI0027196ABA|nr:MULTISPECIES: amidohydrolase family protein [unclassified Conexibacter]MDO8184880.1 amidohydrolase family protein [Conexibacter sp. CPCC 205706]MDO8196655.1 amidohydrolase family protein [Conexibacter sp. CPCC 205762]MDR9371964.1 amidohydrolase family protein [Conexibacter sp. JD483]